MSTPERKKWSKYIKYIKNIRILEYLSVTLVLSFNISQQNIRYLLKESFRDKSGVP